MKGELASELPTEYDVGGDGIDRYIDKDMFVSGECSFFGMN
jgi:hypothetical protein